MFFFIKQFIFVYICLFQNADIYIHILSTLTLLIKYILKYIYIFIFKIYFKKYFKIYFKYILKYILKVLQIVQLLFFVFHTHKHVIMLIKVCLLL